METTTIENNNLQTQEQILVYQDKINELNKKLVKLRDKIRLNDYLLKDSRDMLEWTRANKAMWNESMMNIVQMLKDQKEALSKQNETIHAQLDGYAEFIRKLENNEQLEFDL